MGRLTIPTCQHGSFPSSVATRREDGEEIEGVYLSAQKDGMKYNVCCLEAPDKYGARKLQWIADRDTLESAKSAYDNYFNVGSVSTNPT